MASPESIHVSGIVQTEHVRLENTDVCVYTCAHKCNYKRAKCGVWVVPREEMTGKKRNYVVNSNKERKMGKILLRPNYFIISRISVKS